MKKEREEFNNWQKEFEKKMENPLYRFWFHFKIFAEWYLTGQFIYRKIQDIWHFIRKKPPLWKNALCCGKRFCAYCGGKYRNKKSEKEFFKKL